jgi:F420-dependent oxidoreductase-like protein
VGDDGRMADVIFGAFVPQGWKMDLASIPDPEVKWATALEIAQLAESLGYDSVWVYDHFHNIPRPAHEAVFECWATIAAVSQRTSRIRLGQMVSCAAYRNPSYVAKVTSTIDVLSGGRLDFGIGAGWYEHEFRAYGYGFPPPRERIGVLRETVQIVKSMWTEPDTTFDGRYFQIAGAQCDPKPVQRPHPPVWIGGGGEKLTLRVVARQADVSNFGGKPHEWSRKRKILKEHCAAVGRDEEEIRKTWSPEVFIRESEAELVESGSRSVWGEPFESWRAGNLVGTPDEVAEKVQRYIDMGCTGFVPWCSDYPDTRTLQLFAEKVIPEFR